MAQGESSKDRVCWQIQKFLCVNGSATSKEIFESGDCRCAKATFYKYLDELYEAGDIICKPQRGRGGDKYELSKKAFKKIEEEVIKQKLKEEIDRLPVKKIKSLYEFIDKILMKCVDLTIDKAFLDRMLESFQEEKISKEQIGELKKKFAQWKATLFKEKPYFFTPEEINKMSRAILSGEVSEVLIEKQRKWFDKWYGTLY